MRFNNFFRTGLILVGLVLLSRHTVPLPAALDDLLFGLGAGLEVVGMIMACCDLSKLRDFKRKYLRLPV